MSFKFVQRHWLLVAIIIAVLLFTGVATAIFAWAAQWVLGFSFLGTVGKILGDVLGKTAIFTARFSPSPKPSPSQSDVTAQEQARLDPYVERLFGIGKGGQS